MVTALSLYGWKIVGRKWREVIKELEISSVLQKQAQKEHIIYIPLLTLKTYWLRHITA